MRILALTIYKVRWKKLLLRDHYSFVHSLVRKLYDGPSHKGRL